VVAEVDIVVGKRVGQYRPNPSIAGSVVGAEVDEGVTCAEDGAAPSQQGSMAALRIDAHADRRTLLTLFLSGPACAGLLDHFRPRWDERAGPASVRSSPRAASMGRDEIPPLEDVWVGNRPSNPPILAGATPVEEIPVRPGLPRGFIG